MKLRELGEDQLIAQLVEGLKSRREVIAGPGDDCAVLAGTKPTELLLLKTDCVVEGVHFSPNEKPTAVGWKAMMRALSDFAAMSGVPRYALVTLVVSASSDAHWMKQLYRGLSRAADRFGVAIVGGETSSTRGPIVVSISAVGSVEKERCVLRSGGKVDDLLYVTGRLGGSGRKRHLQFIPRLQEARWLTEHFRIHAMMDLSDGLGADLPRLAKASRLGFEVSESSLPRTRGCSTEQAINDGEDYELLFALSPDHAEALEARWRKKFPRLPLTRIGRLTSHFSPNTPRSFHGYSHFR
jgi:thiamine-monophosphate kinase